MILNKSQAQAVLSAMCELNNVGASFDRVQFSAGVVVASLSKCEGLEVMVRGHTAEEYENQAAFATAYGL